MKSESFTLVHGDFHAQNMFSMKDGTFRLVDWSEFGVGAGCVCGRSRRRAAPRHGVAGDARSAPTTLASAL